tara:strand:- start:4923 stop:6209 length:1287 start_codon:yes stop_codon:yes gene_type:complete
MKLKDLVKIAAPIAIGSIAPGLMPGMNPILARGLASGVGSLVMGGKPKDALLAGALGAGVGAMFPGQQAGAEQMSELDASSKLANLNQSAMEQAAGLTKNVAENVVKGGAGTGAANTVAPVAADTMSAKLLESLGADKDNFLFKILNSQLGEGLAAGLVAQLLAGDDDDEVVGEFERRPFGAGGPGGKLGGINYAQGGAVPQLQQLSQVSAEMADKISDLAGGIAQGASQQGIGNPVAEAGRIDFNIGKPIGFGPGQDPAVTPGLGFPSTMPVKTMFGSGDGRLRMQPVPYMDIPLPAFFKDGGEAKNKNNQPSIMDVINKFKTIETPFGSGVTREQRLELLKRLGMVQTAARGGEMSFPRRNGGIDPSEGSGTKDDVPALLLAGEFVHTRESNEGLGKMMGAKTKDEAARKGIQAQYELMNAFERMA